MNCNESKSIEKTRKIKLHFNFSKYKIYLKKK